MTGFWPGNHATGAQDAEKKSPGEISGAFVLSLLFAHDFFGKPLHTLC
jgi:hypothetical protein